MTINNKRDTKMDKNEFLDLITDIRLLVQHTHDIDHELSLGEFHRLWHEYIDELDIPKNMKKDHHTFVIFYQHYLFKNALKEASGRLESMKKPMKGSHLKLVKG